MAKSAHRYDNESISALTCKEASLDLTHNINM